MNARLGADTKAFDSALRRSQAQVESFGKGLSRLFMAAGGATAFFRLLEAGFKATGSGADRLERAASGLRAGLHELGRTIVELDFNKFAEGLAKSVNAAADLADAIDQTSQRMADLQTLKSSFESRVSVLRQKRYEGTITPEEIDELESLSKKLMGIEQDIYKQSIQDTYKYISDRTGLNATLFNRLEEGVKERAQLNKEELDGISDVGKRFEEVSKELRKKFKDQVVWGADAMGRPQRITIASQEYISAIDQWVSALSGAELAQLTEDRLIGSPEAWKAYLDNLNKRNQLTGEYALQMAKVYRSGNAAQTMFDKSRELIQIPGSTKAAVGTTQKKSLLDYFGINPLELAKTEGANVKGDPYLERLNQQLEAQTNIAYELQGVFSNLFSTMGQGWKATADAVIDSIRRIAAEILAKAAVWAIMSIIFPESALVKQGLGSFMGLTKLGIGSGVNGGLSAGVVPSSMGTSGLTLRTEISGSNLAVILGRGNNSIYGNT